MQATSNPQTVKLTFGSTKIRGNPKIKNNNLFKEKMSPCISNYVPLIIILIVIN